ncbi:MFS transporter [Kluyvera intermedia]|uniref:MFS transporter n=1 Tax=Kluyvera intermedia TaxID=61648 RepID=UPI00352665EE
MRNYIIFTISFFLSFVNFMIFYSFPFRLNQIGLENSFAGIIVGVAACLTLTMRLAFGVIIDKFRLRWALSITALLYCCSIMLISSDAEFNVFIGRLTLGALLGAMSTLLMFYSLTGSENSAEKSKNVSLITFFNVLPTCLAPYVALRLTQQWGAESVTLIALYLFTICLLLAVILDFQSEKKLLLSKHETTSTISGIKGLLALRELRTAVYILALIYVISGTTVTFLPSYLMAVGITDPAPYFLVFTIFMMLPRLFLKKYMPSSSRFPAFFIGLCSFMAVVGTLCNYFLPGTGVWYFSGAILCGTTLGIIYPAIMSYVVCTASSSLSGTSSSLVAAAADLGVIVSNLSLGVVGMSLGLKPAMLLPVVASCAALLLLIARVASITFIKKESSA